MSISDNTLQIDREKAVAAGEALGKLRDMLNSIRDLTAMGTRALSEAHDYDDTLIAIRQLARAADDYGEVISVVLPFSSSDIPF